MTINTPSANVFLKDRNMVVVKYKPNVNVGLNEMIAIHEAERKITQEKKHVVLLDARGYIIISDSARRYGASEKPARYRKAAALLVNTAGVRILGNFYLTFNKPKVPTRMFTEERKAVEWLKQI